MDYIDKVVKHKIQSLAYGDILEKEISDITELYIKSIHRILEGKTVSTKNLSNSFKRRIKEILLNYAVTVTFAATQLSAEIIEKEKVWLSTVIGEALNISFRFPDSAEVMLNNIPFAGMSSVNDMGTTLANQIGNYTNALIENAYITGNDLDSLIEEGNTRLDTVRNYVKNNSRVIGENLSGSYERIIYTKNAGKVKSYIWLAILDSNTCLGCAELDHQIFNDISKVPIYPLHLNDRCILTPVPQSLSEEDFPESYEEWFEEQSEQDKRDILGPNRYQLYQDGMKIKQFARNGKIFKMSDLKRP